MRCVCKLLDQVTDSTIVDRLVNKEITVSASFGYIESYIMIQVGILLQESAMGAEVGV